MNCRRRARSRGVGPVGTWPALDRLWTKRLRRSEPVLSVGPTVCWFRTSATTTPGSTLGHAQPTSKARLVITTLFVDHQTPAEVAARYRVHRAWVYKLRARYEAEGETALGPPPDAPRPHRPPGYPR